MPIGINESIENHCFRANAPHGKSWSILLNSMILFGGRLTLWSAFPMCGIYGVS